MNATHTPGPWSLNLPCFDEVVADFGGNDISIAQAIRNPANARLIAAAPDLLKALKALLRDPAGCRFCDMGRPRKSVLTGELCEHDDKCGFVLARAAIAKAEGNQHG